MRTIMRLAVVVGLLSTAIGVALGPAAAAPAPQCEAIQPQGGGWTTIAGLPTTFASTDAADVSAVDPRSPERLFYADGNNSRLWRSVDGGCNWTMVLDVSLAIPYPEGASRIDYRIAEVDVASDGTLYVSVLRASYLDAIWTSRDGGTTWTRNVDGLPIVGDRIAAHPDALTDVGTNYSLLAVAPSDPKTAYLAVTSGPAVFTSDMVAAAVYVTTDGGASWQWRWRGPDAPAEDPAGFAERKALGPKFILRELAVDPADPKDLWLSSTQELLRSTDGGTTWKTVTENNTPLPGVLGIGIFHRAGEAATIVISPDLYPSQADYLLHSGDGGQSWNRVAAPFQQVGAFIFGRNEKSIIAISHEIAALARVARWHHRTGRWIDLTPGYMADNRIHDPMWSLSGKRPVVVMRLTRGSLEQYAGRF